MLNIKVNFYFKKINYLVGKLDLNGVREKERARRERYRERECLFTCRLSIVDSTVNMYGLIY